jgi:hypothetical protein
MSPDVLTVVSSPHVPDGTQVWMKGREVLDVTTSERARFIAMFGLMQVPTRGADTVMLSTADYDALKAAAVPAPQQSGDGK